MNDPDIDPRLEALPENIFESLNDDSEHLFIIIAAWRFELHPFMERLEHGYYPPGTPANANLTLYLTRWEGLRWAVLGIPLADRWIADRVAEETGTRLADGVPHIMSGGPMKQFPLHSKRTFNLEPRHDRRGPVAGDVVQVDSTGQILRTPLTEAAKKAVNDFLKPKDGPL